MKALRNKKGLSYIDTTIWVLVLCMILSIILTYASMMIQIQTAESNTQRVLDSYVTLNSIEIYDSLKNGHDTTTTLDGNIFISTLSDELSLTLEDSVLYFRTAEGKELYKITNPSVAFEVQNRLKLQATYNIIFPVTFAGQTITNLLIPQKVVSYYNLK